jgi:NADH-quinone oxidoreductase E subunit
VSEYLSKYSEEIKQILEKYPAERKQSAVMPLLFLAQRKEGYLQEGALSEIGQLLDLQETEVANLIGFYTLFHDQEGGRYRVQVCTDLCCALRGSEEFLSSLCEALEIQPGETTKDGLVTVEEVKCLAACDKAPMYQVQDQEGISYHENCTVESALKQISEWREQRELDGEESS